MKTENTNFTYSSNSLIQNNISDSIDMNNVLSVSLNIKASHAGKINSNFVFYTTRSMKKGSETLTLPFKKHLQNLHRGDAVGVINEASFIDYTDKYSEDIATISQKIDTAHNPAELVSAVKELVAHPEYTKPSFKGLGVIQVSAELYNEPLIKELSTGTNKGKVSIGGNSRQVYCSVCSELFTKKHEHTKGKTYNGETCFAIYDDMVLDHIGFVPDPADDRTETVIVSTISDSISDEDASVSIEHINIQDNIQGNVNNMNLEELRQKLKADSGYSISLVTDITDAQKTALVENLASSTKFLRGSGYLVTDEKLLPINTKENIALAKLVLDQLEDGPEKQGLLDMLTIHVNKHFSEGEDTLATLQAFGIEEVKTDPKEGEATAQAEAGTGATTTTEEGVTTVPVNVANLSEEALTALTNSIVMGVVERMKPSQTETQAIADSAQVGLVLSRNKQLESDIAALDIQNNELTNKYKASIINQILAHKGISTDDSYSDTLNQRDIDSLTLLLEDIQHDITRTKAPKEATKKEGEANPKEATTEAGKVIEKVAIKDSVTTGAEASTEQNTVPTQLPSIREVGLTNYLKAKEALNK